MKVLHVLNELKHSGAETMLKTASERFKSRGIQSHLLSTGDQIGDYASVLRQAGYRIHHLPFRKSPRFFSDFRSLLKREKFNALHIHPERAFIWYIMVARLAGVRTVVKTFHSIFLFSGYLRWKRKLQRRASSKIFRTMHIAIGESVLTVERLRFQNNCILIRSWTDVERFRPPNEEERAASRQLYGLEAGDFAIITIGACIDVKNHLAIFSAIKQANNLLDGPKIVALHVGTGPLLEVEKSYARRNSIEQYCRFLGTLDDVRPCLYAANAFVMTSQWEGLPIAAVEAMSTGLPAILYNAYGLRDLLQDGKGGLLIEPKEDRLVEALLLMSRNSELRKVKAREAREKMLSTFSLEHSVDKFSHIYTTGACN